VQVSTSHKCSEIDKLVPEMLGVSSAIMENVIFCHQEESSWPMSEGIVLKKKFDDVFESTRYTKALEAVLKTKKDNMLVARDLKVYVCRCIYVYMEIEGCICKYVYVYIHICTYIDRYMHTYIHTYVYIFLYSFIRIHSTL
jgi:hypothetical protein